MYYIERSGESAVNASAAEKAARDAIATLKAAMQCDKQARSSAMEVLDNLTARNPVRKARRLRHG
jgi:hypothetical protein